MSCYEAGPTGYQRHRQLLADGIESLVVVPQRLDVDGRGQKTNRLDARALVERLERYHRGNRQALAIVRMATPEQEQEQARVQARLHEHRFAFGTANVAGQVARRSEPSTPSQKENALLTSTRIFPLDRLALITRCRATPRLY
ncbi:MAG TPA: hypothetical protein VGF85_07110 [Opitutaceae bacterium]